VLGIARCLHTRQDSLAERLARIQHELFDAGADFASGSATATRVSEEHIARYEAWIDEYTAEMPPLKNFILPAGHPVSAQLQQARTVCRRAERRAVEALLAERIDPVLVQFLNRLADLLFVLARYANHVYGVAEEPWQKQV
jgi:cob(I)alamin adenosyltransferase